MKLIATPEELAPRIEQWHRADWLALDTEFVRETTYYPKPCLLQVSDGEQASCIDLIALEGAALEPLFALLAAPRILKVFHSASQDLELFVQVTGDCPRPLFDTQVAMTLLGEGDQIGYAALVEKRLGVIIDKTLTRTDWSRRPLSDAELAYAADDVRYLAILFPPLREDLIARGRLPWLEEDCTRMTEAARYLTRPEDAWKRLKGIARLGTPGARAVAAGLAAWREAEAQRRNRPRKWILEDDAIYRLAERRPDSSPALASLAALPPKTLDKHGAAVLAVIAAARDQVPPEVSLLPSLEGAEKKRFQSLQSVVRERAQALGIPAPLLAGRADLETLARNPEATGVLAMQGWRREQLAEALSAAGCLDRVQA